MECSGSSRSAAEDGGGEDERGQVVTLRVCVLVCVWRSALSSTNTILPDLVATQMEEIQDRASAEEEAEAGDGGETTEDDEMP
eukprot:879665-Rhodomonas_salina.2